MGEHIKAPETLLPTLLQRLQLAEARQAGWQARVQAIHALGEKKDVSALMPAFTDQDESVRVAAVQVCASWGEEAPVQQLLTCLQDQSSLVREAAIFTLGTLDNEKVWQPITAAQFDPSPIVREAALQMLTQQTPPASHYNETPPLYTLQQKRVAESRTEYVRTDEEAIENSFELDNPATTNNNSEIIPLRGKATLGSVSKSKKRWRLLGTLVAAILLFSLLGSWFAIVYLPGVQTAQDNTTPRWTYTDATLNDNIAWSTDSSQISFTAQQNQLNTYNMVTHQLDTYPEVDTGTQMQADHSQIMTSNVSPGGKYRVGIDAGNAGNTKKTGSLYIWDSKTGQLLASHPYSQPADLPQTDSSHTSISSPILLWSKDNESMATIDGKGNVLIWHAQTAQRIFSPTSTHVTIEFLHAQSPTSTNGTVEKIAWSQDNKTLALATTNGYLEIWNTLTEKLVGSGLVASTVQTVSVSPDGRYAAAGDFGNTLSILDTQSGKVVDHSLTISYQKDGNLSWSKDSHYMIVFTNGDGENKITTTVWDIAHDKKMFEKPSSAQAASVLSPDGRDIAVASPDNQQIDIWEINTGRKVATHKGKMGPNSFTLIWSPNSKSIASTYQDTQVQLWDPQNGQDITTYNKFKGEVQTILWSPNGAYIAISKVERTQIEINHYSFSNPSLAIWSVPTH
ncbi:hypothetical protein KDA_11610 [Dictyobacter alpinus]|uniref:Uncharacterized protein n=1 Tax=Dictyobacter alpinus TaxID=2014873 RepID=A0A402B2Y8_9CHLR|nr:HEAT repeat domain-containing protein [Dictyobacter alpinus]GCE25677.1 hypothetical protein KDA_11610 [Dictyobacter alpinus]